MAYSSVRRNCVFARRSSSTNASYLYFLLLSFPLHCTTKRDEFCPLPTVNLVKVCIGQIGQLEHSPVTLPFRSTFASYLLFTYFPSPSLYASVRLPRPTGGHPQSVETLCIQRHSLIAGARPQCLRAMAIGGGPPRELIAFASLRPSDHTPVLVVVDTEKAAALGFLRGAPDRGSGKPDVFGGGSREEPRTQDREQQLQTRVRHRRTGRAVTIAEGGSEAITVEVVELSARCCGNSVITARPHAVWVNPAEVKFFSSFGPAESGHGDADGNGRGGEFSRGDDGDQLVTSKEDEKSEEGHAVHGHVRSAAALPRRGLGKEVRGVYESIVQVQVSFRLGYSAVPRWRLSDGEQRSEPLRAVASGESDAWSEMALSTCTVALR